MKFILIVLFALSLQGCGDSHWTESEEVGKLFKNAHQTGTFVLYDVSNNSYTGYNQTRAKTRYTPASTYKIANTLIGLSTGAVKSVDDILPYGDEPQPFKKWENDMGLREAIMMSNVPIYQTLARKIGLEKMQKYISLLDYGNKKIGTLVDRFWLHGPLKISAIEQTRFLAKLAANKLPVPDSAQNKTREILLLEKGADWALYGKTGWQSAKGAEVGWWVGWVKKKSHIYAFALNLLTQEPSNASKRIELGKASLKALGILDQ